MPLQALQNRETDIAQEQVLLSNMGAAVGALATSIQGLAKLGSTKALAAASTDSAVMTATVTGATSPTSYSITSLSSIARNASETSQNSYSDAVSGAGVMKLVYGSNIYTINLAAGKNNLAGVRKSLMLYPTQALPPMF